MAVIVNMVYCFTCLLRQSFFLQTKFFSVLQFIWLSFGFSFREESSYEARSGVEVDGSIKFYGPWSQVG